MKDSTIKKIEEVYDRLLEKLEDIEALQKKMFKAYIRKLEKEKIQKLKEELQK